MHDAAADDGHHRSDVLDLIVRVIAIKYGQVGDLPCFDRSEIALAEQQVGVAARVGDERLLSADRLPQELVAARWLRFTTG